jgi:hypothetical protein
MIPTDPASETKTLSALAASSVIVRRSPNRKWIHEYTPHVRIVTPME